MTPAARIAATIELLDRIFIGRVPMDTVTGDYFRARKYVGSKDRSAVAERVYSIMRHNARLSWWATRLGLEKNGRTLALLDLALIEGAGGRRIMDLFDGSRYGPAELTDAEKGALTGLDPENFEPAEMPPGVKAECPPEHEARLCAIFGENFAAEMAAMLQPATLDIRVNLLKIDRENAAKSLAADGVETQPLRYSPWGLRLLEKTYLSETKAFKKGWIDIQDEGSQLIALLCGAKPGQQVLDYCAGAGGKTLGIAGAMGNKGRIVAMDLEAGRLERARPRFRRAGVHDIIEVRPLSDEKNRKWLRRQKGTFDAVLVDVPCSGSGTWRRNPDMRWHTYGPTLEELMQTQSEILDKVADTVKQGGRLVYATCSLFREENEDQIAAFLARRPDYTLLPLARAWPAGTPVPCEGDMMRLSPARNQTDGFFTAVLQKTGE